MSTSRCKREHTQEVFVVVDDVDVVHRLCFFGNSLKCGNRVRCAQIWRDRNKTGRHDAAGGIGREREELANLGSVAGSIWIRIFSA